MENEKTAAREEKHIQLDLAIGQIRTIIDRLESLNDRIVGPAPRVDCENNTKHQEPTLLMVLNEGSEKIRGLIDSAHVQIDKIESSLF